MLLWELLTSIFFFGLPFGVSSVVIDGVPGDAVVPQGEVPLA